MASSPTRSRLEQIQDSSPFPSRAEGVGVDLGRRRFRRRIRGKEAVGDRGMSPLPPRTPSRRLPPSLARPRRGRRRCWGIGVERRFRRRLPRVGRGRRSLAGAGHEEGGGGGIGGVWTLPRRPPSRRLPPSLARPRRGRRRCWGIGVERRFRRRLPRVGRGRRSLAGAGHEEGGGGGIEGRRRGGIEGRKVHIYLVGTVLGRVVELVPVPSLIWYSSYLS